MKLNTHIHSLDKQSHHRLYLEKCLGIVHFRQCIGNLGYG